jgi:hypothetical protein
MSRPVKVILVVLVVLLSVYVSVLILCVSLKPFLTFVPLKQFLSDNLESFQDIWTVNSHGDRLHGRLFEKRDPTATTTTTTGYVLLAHGNGGNLTYYQSLVSFFAKLGCHVLCFDYPGYGNSQGKPSETNCYEAGLLFYQYIVHNLGIKPAKIILAGMSLGGAIAARLAATQPSGGLVLISTFVSPRKLLCTLFKPLWLVSFVANEFFLNDDLVKLHASDPEFSAKKCVVMHSKKDGLIDFSHAELNSKTLGNCPVVELEGWHADPVFTPQAYDAVKQLLSHTT